MPGFGFRAMGNNRQFELLLVRLVPHALRDDFMTVGVVVVEPGGEFADFRITRDWERVACFAPDLEMEVLEHLEAAVREGIGSIRGRGELARLLEERFGEVFDVGPVKALEARNPSAEMQVLERDYLAPILETPGGERARRMGRVGIVSRMSDAFEAAGVLGLLARNLDMGEFTGKHDPFRVDFGYRVGRTLKMFQALALNLSREPAVTLAYRYARIQAGVRARGEDSLMTAIISEEAARTQGEAAKGLKMLRANEIIVRDIGKMSEIAEAAKREIGA